MKKFYTFVKYFFVLVISVIVGVGMFSANAATLSGNQTPMPFGYGVSVVLSGSMEPTISINDLIIIRESDSYDVGDIVVYQSGRMSVVHRIKAVLGDSVVTQGDANNIPDEPFDRSNIKGRVIAVIPRLGLVFRALKTPAGILSMLGLAVFLIESSFRIKKTADEKKNEDIKSEIRRLKQELEVSQNKK